MAGLTWSRPALSVVAELSAVVTLSMLGWVQVAPVGSHRVAEISP